MNRRLVQLGFVWLAALALAGPASAQLPQFPGLGSGATDEAEGIKVQLATNDPREVVQRLKQQLLERQQALIAAAPDLEAWQTERQRYLERLAQARERLAALQAELVAEQEETQRWREARTAREKREIERERRARERAERARLLRERRAAAADAGSTAPDGGSTAPDAGPSPADAGPTAPDAGPAAADEAPLPPDLVDLPELPDPGPAPGATYPGYQAELERYIRLLEVASEELHYLIAGLAEERELVAAGIDRADQLLARLEEERERERDAGAAPQPPVSLAEARSISYDLYLARLELSLARSREASLEQEREEPEETRDILALLRPPSALEVPEEGTERMQETWQAARQLRDDGSAIATRVSQLLRTRTERIAELLQTRLRVSRIDVRAKEQRANQLAAELDRALDRIRITPQDLEAARARLDSLSGKIAADIERVQTELERLRAEPVPEGSLTEARFTPAFVRELRLAALQEELTYHELRRERMHFVFDSETELAGMLRGEPPADRYLERYERILDPAEQARRHDEIGQRHEAWRRQHMQLQRKPASPGHEDERTRALGHLLSLVELCAKQEYTLESETRLADIVRHHLRAYEAKARSVWWYVWRGLLSAFLVLLAVLASILLGRITIRSVRAIASARSAEELRAGDPAERPRAIRWRATTLAGARTVTFGLYLVGLAAIWLGAIFVALQLAWGLELGLERIDTIMEAPLFLVGDTQITLSAIARLVVTVLLAIFVARLVHVFLERQVFQFFEWDQGIRHAVSVVLRYIVLFVGVSLGLEYIGLGLGAFAVLLGVIGIGIGFGLQNIANNFISGFIILFERPVKKGDFVVTGELEGEVQTISARATTVRTRDNVSVIIPNSEFISGRVVNWSHDDPRIRLRIPVGVAYGSDIAKVERILIAVAREHPKILARPRPEAWFMSFGDSSLNFELLAWTRNVKDRFRTASDLNKAIDAAFRAEGVTIPFPQRDLHVKSAVTVPTRPLPTDPELP